MNNPLPFSHNEGMYQCVAVSIEAFVQQLAVSYMGAGYWFYVTGDIPSRKTPAAVDEKLLQKYDVGMSKWARARRKRAGFANLHYLRFERFFVLIATKGKHLFFDEHPDFKDVRRQPLKFAGYSISYKLGNDQRWHTSVRIHPEEYKKLKAHLVEIALHRSVEKLCGEFRAIPFEPYAPVRRQMLNILRAVNRERKAAGYELVPMRALRLSRKGVKVFGMGGTDEI